MATDFDFIKTQLANITYTVQRFNGTGAQTSFLLAEIPASDDLIAAFINGVLQPNTNFSLSGQSVVFGAAPPSGVGNVEIVVAPYIAHALINAEFIVVGGQSLSDALTMFTATYSTYAKAQSAAPGLKEGQRIEIEADETRDGRGTRNVVQDGALVFVGFSEVNLSGGNLDASGAWDDVPQVSAGAPAQLSASNAQAQALLNRTEFLAEQSEDLQLDTERRTRQSLTQMSTFRKKVKANLPFVTAHYAAQKAVQSGFNGSTSEFYPQGFCVDWERRELFILRKGSIVLIEVYDWDTLAFKTSFFTKTDANTYTTASSEQPVIRTIAGRRKLFTKGITRNITRFDIQVLPANLGAVVMDASWDVNVFTSFAYKNGTWFVEDASYPVMEGVYKKTRYIKYDPSFNRVGEVEIGAHISGLDDELTDSSSRVSKKQGMCIAMGGIFFGVGGRRGGTADVYDYRHQGVRFLNGSGDVMMDSTVRHSEALAILKNNGVVCEFIENEGVQVDEDLGNVYGLYACLDESSPGANTAGILILQEFCADADAIDLTKAAAFNTYHNTRLMSGLAAISTGGNLYNPITGVKFMDWAQVCKYMRETDRELYTYWSSSVVSLKMPDGTNVPSGLRITIQNTNGSTFFVRGVGLYQDRLWRIVWNDNGSHAFLEMEDRAYKNKLPYIDGVVNLGQSDIRWNNVFAATGTINTSDAREKAAPISIAEEVLDAWGDVQLICFQWLSSVMEKGEDSARWHFGVIAQQVRDAFAARGLDGTKYGLLCYDEWKATPEVLDEKGSVIEPARESGNRWGIRADQCLFLEAAYQRRLADRIEERLAVIEARL